MSFPVSRSTKISENIVQLGIQDFKSASISSLKRTEAFNESLGTESRTHSDDESAMSRQAMRWLQQNVRLPTSLACCHRIPMRNSDVEFTHYKEKNFSDRNTIQEKDFGSSTGLCTCSDNPQCLIHGHVKADLNERRIFKAINNTPKGYRLLFITMTIQHSRENELDELLAVLNTAFMEIERRKNDWEGSFVGEVLWRFKKIEVQHSLVNGDHPHLHLLVAVKSDQSVGEIKKSLVRSWKKSISSVVLDGRKKNGQLKARRQNKSELEVKRSVYQSTTKHGIDIREVKREFSDVQKISAYAAKGIAAELSAEMKNKSGKADFSFSIPQLISHASGLSINDKISEWEDNQNWESLCASSANHYWINYFEKYFKAMLGREIYTYDKGFREYAALDKEKTEADDKRMENQKVKYEVGRVLIPSDVAKELSWNDGFAKLNWFYSKPDLNRLINYLKMLVPIGDFQRVKLILPETPEIQDPPLDVEISPKDYDNYHSIETWLELKKSSDEPSGWVSVDLWEEVLISKGIALKDAADIPLIKTYNEQTKGFQFRVGDGGQRLMRFNGVVPYQRVTAGFEYEGSLQIAA